MAGPLIVAIALTLTAAVVAMWWAIEYKPRNSKHRTNKEKSPS